MAKKFNKNSVIIAVPSYQRADNINLSVAKRPKFCTASYIVGSGLESRTTYFVEAEEADSYREALPSTVGLCRKAGNAAKPKIWGSIMDYIVDFACFTEDVETLIIMDDDLALAERPNLPDEPTKFVDLSPEGFYRMVVELRSITDINTPLTSVQYRQFCQGKKDQYQHNQRISMIWSMDCEFFRRNPQYRFYEHSKLESMTDYYFFMKLLSDGIPNKVINRYTKDDKANAPGGISHHRTMARLNRAAKKLAKMFPDHVYTYVKEGKGAWADGTLGVRIQAHKCHKDAAKRLNG